MNKENKDSTVTTYVLDEVCIIGGYCRIHSHMHVDSFHEKGMGVLKQYTPDYSSALDMKYEYYISDSGQILFHEKDTSVYSISEFEMEVKKNMLKLSSDTIAPTYYHEAGDTRSASQIIGTIKPKAMLYAKEKEDYNDEVNSGAFTLMLLIVILYAYNSYSHWTSLIGKIKMAIRN
jgi:hypothetical protein